MTSFIESWRSGQVMRKHVMENIRAENVAEHTWGVVHLLMMMWPDVPVRVVMAAHYHDFGERATGDLPGPVKWSNPVLEAEMERLEKEHMMSMLPEHIRVVLESVDETEWAVVEFCDRMEFCISMSRERRLGNSYSLLYFRRALAKANKIIEDNREKLGEKSESLWDGILTLRSEITEELHTLEVL